MKLRKLVKDLKGANVKGSKEIEITGICANSKLVSPGSLFIAKKGFSQNGGEFIPEAIEAGAVAVVTDIYNPLLKNIVQVIHPDVASIEGRLASSYYQHPSDDLFMVGVTGTNGKTTTSFLIKHVLDSIKQPCGLIGTIEYIIGKYRYQATRTTPDVTSNHKMLREMVLQGCSSAVMEVTSHALDQGRVENIDFDVAVFTNLTLDHLDYHHTMENYANAKNKLFRSLNLSKKKKGHFSKVAILNGDSPWLETIKSGTKVPLFTYGLEGDFDLKGSNISLTSTGTLFDVTYRGVTKTCFSPLVGKFNVYNCLAAIAVGLSRQIPLDNLIEIIREAPSVPGRLQPVPNPLGLKIYVDFAHTDDALTNVLSCLKEMKPERLITLFGCGGDRDQSKRAKMAQSAEAFSDLAIVTSDNPRSEDPLEIIRQIEQGFKNKTSYQVEPDRQLAIEKAIKLATPRDILLIAGKGHETYQIFAHKTVEFDDAKIAEQSCQQIHSQYESRQTI